MNASESQTYIAILRRVGSVLIAIGLIDIAVMIYCVINGFSYSSSFNIFAVIAGVLLLRGGLTTAAVVRWYATFMLAAFVALILALLVIASIHPSSLASIHFILNPGTLFVSVAFALSVLAFLLWVIREIGREPVQAARVAAGRKSQNIRIPALLGIGLAAVILGFLLSSGGPYSELEVTFLARQPASAPSVSVDHVVMTSTKKTGAYSYSGVLAIKLLPGVLEIDPKFPFSAGMKDVAIRTDQVAGCSKTCFGPEVWDANVLISTTGTEISFRNSQEIIDWCWTNKIPMISAKDKRQWLYSGANLPDRTQFSEQLSSRELYDQQSRQSCMGY